MAVTSFTTNATVSSDTVYTTTSLCATRFITEASALTTATNGFPYFTTFSFYFTVPAISAAIPTFTDGRATTIAQSTAAAMGICSCERDAALHPRPWPRKLAGFYHSSRARAIRLDRTSSRRDLPDSLLLHHSTGMVSTMATATSCA